MPRQKLGPRVNGPYYDSPTGKYKLRVFVSYSDKGSDLYYDTEDSAQQSKEVIKKELTTPSIRPLGQILLDYMTEKEQRGRAKPESCKDQLRALRAFFFDALDDDLTRITPKRAAALYEQAIAVPKANGESRKAATHRFYLELAKGFFQWIVQKGYLTQNPFKEVIPVGRVSVGKTQLRLEEARMYAQTAFRLFDENKDILALASVVPLYLGLRASEVLRRKVRDVDAGGTLFWIDSGKTKHARRHLKVEAKELQERLAGLTQGRNPEEPLFGYGETGKPRRPQALWTTTKRICKAAGVPLVCPHSFRGLWATLSVESGAASSAVATALGHGSFAMTARHYAQPEAVANARSARVIDMLRKEPSADPLSELSPEQIIERLSPNALAKLAEVLNKAIAPAEPKKPVPV